jgi:allantoinase
MALPDDYLRYAHRGYGMDHKFYAWSVLPHRAKVAWPNRARVALWINIPLEWFPLNSVDKPFRPTGGLERPFPDYWNYTYRDYGNRVGCYRLFRVIDELGLLASVAMNASLAQRIPYLVEHVVKGGYEVVAHGVDMGHVHSGQPIEEERAWIKGSLDTLRELTKQKVRGWMSPDKSQTANTLQLLAEQRVEYCCDWPNDDMPYALMGPAAGLTMMPHATELSDLICIHSWQHTTEEFAEQIVDQFNWLHREAETSGGRIFTVTLHPWISGQPHRVRPIRRALETIISNADVWPATGSEILDAFKAAR